MPANVASGKTTRMNLNVPSELHHAFKVSTVLQGKDMTTVLIQFIEQYVDKHYPKQLPKKGRR
ncbi:MAG TPA: plasmid partition protein ParG [Terriglobales bacterium]|nr:plasmid partition protein ParG [Terriglobales bacterium]